MSDKSNSPCTVTLNLTWPWVSPPGKVYRPSSRAKMPTEIAMSDSLAAALAQARPGMKHDLSSRNYAGGKLGICNDTGKVFDITSVVNNVYQNHFSFSTGSSKWY